MQKIKVLYSLNVALEKTLNVKTETLKDFL